MIPSAITRQELYRRAFVHNCFLLLLRARNQIKGIQLASQAEPSITGLLVAAARELTEMEDAEPWLNALVVLDDPPQNDNPRRFGKARPRIDIEFVEVRGNGRRPRFHVEAKRLYRSDSVNEYLGAGGIGMFVNGSYASEWPSAGMLGYVQTSSCASWLAAIQKGIASRKEALRMPDPNPEWRPVGWPTEGLLDVRESFHHRSPESLGQISIFHFLLDVQQTVPDSPSAPPR